MAPIDTIHRTTPSGRRAVFLCAVLSATIAIIDQGSSDGRPLATFPSIALADGSLALMWMLSSIGMGMMALSLIRVRNALPPLTDWTIGAAFGVALMVALDNLLATVGLLSVAATTVTAIGLGCFVWTITHPRQNIRITERVTVAPLLLALPIAALLAAASSTPGWLWRTEFGGYDAQAYHLQGPREWLASGVMDPSASNVYLSFPSWIEGAYLHLMVLRGNAWDASIACQWLHAGIAIVAALLVGSALRVRMMRATPESSTMTGRWPLPVLLSVIAVLATPWLTVTGSLAYTESGVLLGTAGMLAALLWTGTDRDGNDLTAQRAVLVGLFAALAVGSKLSSIALVVLPMFPIAIVAVVELNPQHRWRALGWATGSFLLPLLPWLIRNTLASGNPLFPFAGSVFGLGTPHDTVHWTTAQDAAFAAAHHAPPSAGFVALWNEWIAFGIGTRLSPSEPWVWQWGPFPWIALAAAALVWVLPASKASRIDRALSLTLVLQLLFWMVATHQRSRFLIPTLPVGALLIGIQAARISWSEVPRTARSAITVLLAAWCLLPAWILLHDGPPPQKPLDFIGANPRPRPLDFIGANEVANGHWLAKYLQDDQAPSSKWITSAQECAAPFACNHLAGEKRTILLVGDSAPFWIEDPFITASVWDGAGLASIIEANPSDSEAWVESIRSLGATHVLFDDAMLSRWRHSGWLSLVVSEDAIATLRSRLDLVTTTRQGALYRVPPRKDTPSENPK
ncbi:MAG: hypothetical protein O2800_00690 [Planctomycetota bacterium]|nr:hypothetical protein [Planctomycetota bacterium]